jgi:hypothetical protein
MKMPAQADGAGIAAWRTKAGELIELLQARGLVAVLDRHCAVLVHNPVAPPELECPGGGVSVPGLRQEVRCAQHADGALWWYWVWWDADRRAQSELEPLCPLDRTQTAADRIAAVVAVPRTAMP